MLTILQGLGFVGGTTALVILAMVLVRGRLDIDEVREHHDVAGFVYAVVGVIYGVLLAFVVVAVWDEFKAADGHVRQEAASIGELVRLAQGLPEPGRSDMRGLLITYARTVVDKEWASLAEGKPAKAAGDVVDDLWMVLLRTEPRTEHQRIIYAKSLDSLSELTDARDLRLIDSTQGLPRVFWVVLIVGGLGAVGFSFLFALRSLVAQGLIVALLSLSILLQLFLIYSLDYPFRGDVRVTPEAFEAVLIEIEGQHPR